MNSRTVMKLIIAFSLLLFAYSGHASESEPVFSFTKVITLESTKESVWSALTTPGELSQWWNEGVILEPHVGGRFYEPWGDNQLATGTVLAVEPLHLITFSWQEKTWQPSQKTQCTFSLSENGGIVTLKVLHSGWETFQDPTTRDQMMEGFSGGWDFFLGKLKKFMEHSAVSGKSE